MVSIVKKTSSAVTGSPSCHRALARRWNVQVPPSAVDVQEPASAGLGAPVASSVTSPSKTSATRSRSAPVVADSGLADLGRPRTPSVYVAIAGATLPTRPGVGGA